jgi:RTX calcium-binding nonapeptide repeat (4 copies)
MIWIRRLVLPVGLVLLGVVAAPAQATLLVRSDGSGLTVMDKNGLDGFDTMGAGSRGGRTAYVIHNITEGDIFKFDRQTGCHPGSTASKVVCDRNGPKINVQLAGGDDTFLMSGSPIGDSSVAGSAGNDFVLGHDGRDNLNGGTGNDELKGLGGNDPLKGRDGDDRLIGGNGNDDLEGDDGADRLEGDAGNDKLRGEDGPDSLFGDLGVDNLSGGADGFDPDFIESREPDGTTARADTVNCFENDDVVADLPDIITHPERCDDLDIAPVGETPHVRIRARTLGVSSTGRVRVRLRCPRGVGSLGCNGSLRLAIARTRRRGGQSSRSRRVRYRIDAGRRKTVRLRLTRRDVRTLRRNRRRGRRTRGRLRSVERGLRGRKTTIRGLRLRLRGR